MSRICIDLGATNVKGALVENGQILTSSVTKTNAHLGFDAIVKALTEAIDDQLDKGENKENPPTGIALSSAGTIDSDQRLCTYATPNLPGFTGFKIGDFLENRYHLPVSVLNDGLAALLGEIAVDSSLKCKRVVMLTLGSGVGGAYAVNGKIQADKRNDFCLYGHYEMISNGLPCNCGKCGCIEQYISGRAINRLAAEYGIKCDRIFEEYRNGTSDAKDAVTRFREYLRLALGTIEKTDPFDVCLLGGGAADGMRDVFDEIIGGLGYDIRRAKAGNTAGMIGADAFFKEFYHLSNEK